MNQAKLAIIFIAVTIFILFGGVYVLNSSNPTQVVSSQNAKAIVSQKTYDWGQIAYGGGNVSKTFTIKNSGSDVLKLTNVKTSCDCTKAQIMIDSQSSPYFSMHGISSWLGEVSPGKEAKLTVIFDPAFHGPSGVGPIERLVSMETNDASNPRLEFSLKGVVMK